MGKLKKGRPTVSITENGDPLCRSEGYGYQLAPSFLWGSGWDDDSKADALKSSFQRKLEPMGR